MATRVIDDTKLQNIAVAIQSKDSGGQMTVDEMPTRIANIPSDSVVEEKTVNFYNYTGELVHSYTAEEIENLTELPEAPTVQGMTFQTWNWSLADIKSWVQNHDEGSLPVGAVFVTDDGHTRIYMHLREPKMASTKMPFCIQRMAGSVIIDWGDGSQPETITATGIYSHLWQVNSYPADVIIDIEYIPSGLTKLVLGRSQLNVGLFNANSYYASCVKAMHFGANIDILDASVCRNCKQMKEVSISDSITAIGSYAFYDCTNLALTVLPDGITSISDYAFYGCTNLALTVLPDGVTRIGGYAFQDCTSLYIIDLTAFTNPQSIPTLANTNAFQGIPAEAQFQVSSQEMYDAFAAATNWSTYASKFVIEGA